MGEILLLIKQQKCSVNIKQHKMYIYPENVHKQIDSSGFSNAVVTFISLLFFSMTKMKFRTELEVVDGTTPVCNVTVSRSRAWGKRHVMCHFPGFV